MKTDISQKVKIGIFTIAGILLFVIGIFFIGSKKNMFGNTFLIYGTFKNVGGLAIGNNIRFAGINVGTVEDIQIVSDTLIRVDMRMKSKVKPFLKVDALASIGVDGLMGDKLITIASGSANEIKLLNRGSQIMTVNPVDFDKVISRFTNVATNAEIITHELAGMAVQIREGKSTIGRLLYTDNLSKSLENTASNAESITSSLAGIASEIKSGKGSVGKLIYTDSLSDGLASVVTTANKSMLTIQEAADGFSENMKALHGNYFLRGYFKRKVRDEANKANNPQADTLNGIDTGMTEAELKDIITDAQNALKAKQEKK